MRIDWTDEANKQKLLACVDEDGCFDDAKASDTFPSVKVVSLNRQWRKFREVKAPTLDVGDKPRENEWFSANDLLKYLSRKRLQRLTVIELANHFDVSPRTIEDTIVLLRENGVLIDNVGEALQVASAIPHTDDPQVIDMRKHVEREFCFGAVADTHLGSKYERLDVLNSLYDRFADYGVKTVYHGGNMIDGEARFNRYDIYVHGVEDQVANFVEKYPQRKGITTQYVTGDDHEGWYVQREHINIGQVIQDRAIESGRDDLIHLGYIERDLEFKQANGSSTIRVIHAGGGSTYAISYTAQKYVESLQGGEKPALVLVGHFHKFDYSYPREVHVVQVGCTQDQTPFMRKKRIQAMVGGCVIWVKQNDLGVFTSVKVEWMPYYDKRFYQYIW